MLVARAHWPDTDSAGVPHCWEAVSAHIFAEHIDDTVAEHAGPWGQHTEETFLPQHEKNRVTCGRRTAETHAMCV